MAKQQVVAYGLAAAAVAASAAVGGGVTVAQAADLYIPEPEAVVAVPDDWTGCYVGVHAGYGWGVVEIVDDPYDFEDGFDYDIAGWLAGGQIGCNQQIDGFAVGIEADLALANITGGVDDIFPEVRTDVHWLGTLRGRAGVVADQWFFYGTAGLAAAGTTSFLDIYEEDAVRYGWVAGLGAEMKLTTDISVKAEYLFHDFGDKAFNFGGANVTDNLTLSTFKVGVNLHF